MRPANQPPVPPLPPAPDSAGHLPLPLLRQYVAGTLPAAEQHRIEAHTLDCPRCAEILDGLEVSGPAATEQALSELRQRLRLRVAQEAAPRHAAQAWQAVAAVLLLLLVSTAVWWGLRPARRAPEPVAVIQLAPPAPSASAPAASPVTPVAPPVAVLPPTVAAATEAPRRPALQQPIRPQRRMASAPPAADAALSSVAEADAELQSEPAVATLSVAPAAASEEITPAVGNAAGTEKPRADTASNSVARASATKPAEEERALRKAALPSAPVISPQPVGGYIGLREYLSREAMFVPEPPARGLSGSVRVKFTVTASGKLENFQVVRGLRKDYDAEAIRLLCEGPAWQPGAANGRRVDQAVEISVMF